MRKTHLLGVLAGISGRIAVLSWSITLLTLVIFVVVIVPVQKQAFQANLESKARGIAVALQDVAASAVVTEDYSAVVDHCLQLLAGDPEISFLVMTRNDGFSLILDRSGWRSQTLNGSWRPARRASSGGIEFNTLFERRGFTYSQPFDYSGIQWGWTHVGLSLETYDRSVAGVYMRTGALAVLCVALSLAMSMSYARRLVKPLLRLQEVVGAVAQGDLSARADIKTGDEVESLGRAFNSMTDNLLRRDRIVASVRFAAQELLSTDDWREVIESVLARTGTAASAHRAFVFENVLNADMSASSVERFRWVAAGLEPGVAAAPGIVVAHSRPGLERFSEQLRTGHLLAVSASRLSPDEQVVLGSDAKSALIAPITVRERWWGVLSFHDCRNERDWGAAERDSLKAATDMIGAAIERKLTQDALIEAKETLEQRVRERTKELQEQIAQKEAAHAKLADAQQTMIEMSRRSGMAEVATGVLHNVGNVLNSINVSATLVTEQLQRSRITNLPKLAELLKENEERLAEFLTTDPKGRHVPGYLASLAELVEKERTELIDELSALRTRVDHVKEIVAMQQSYARVSGVLETVPVESLVEDALKMNDVALARHRIRVVREFADVPAISVDKHKVLQILLNLIRNAKYAMEDRPGADRVLTVGIRPGDPGTVRIDVRDNGVGIPPENLTKIFSHGFTTRVDGHGFGLHSGALAAREMGGTLEASSGGIGKGATFTLELPLELAEVQA